MNRKDIFMNGFRSKLTYPFSHKDLAEFETIINFYEGQIQKYKEVINKAINYIETHKRKDEFLELNEWGTRDLLDILKEVEHE